MIKIKASCSTLEEVERIRGLMAPYSRDTRIPKQEETDSKNKYHRIYFLVDSGKLPKK